MIAGSKLLGSTYAALAGFAGLSVGIGLLRFAYSPIVPSLIEHQWTTVSQAAWLGSSNFWGYIVGVVIALPLSRRIQRQRLLLGSMLVGIVSLAACGWNLGFQWMMMWRFVQGLTGAFVMAILPGGVMAAVPEEHRRVVGGFTIAGVGFAAVQSVLTPEVSSYGPTEEWILSAVLASLCTLVVWPFITRHITGLAQQPGRASLSSRHRRPYVLFLIAYTLAGAALIPDTLFLSDYLNLTLHAPPSIASARFSWFAVGLATGSVSGGLLANRFGSFASIVLLTCVGLAGNSVILLSDSVFIVSFGSFFFAIWAGGTVSIASIRTLELVGSNAHGRYWPMMCFAYAVGMWVASTGFAAMASQGSELIVFFWFVEGLAAVFIAFAIASYWRPPPHGAAGT